MIHGETSACYFSRGAYTVGKEILGESLDGIRLQVEKCDSFQGFLFYHSVVGGTGSGFTEILSHELSVEYGKKTKMSYTVWPSPRLSNCVVEDYNALLCSSFLTEHSDVTVMLDNE